MSVCFVCCLVFPKEKIMWRHVTRKHMQKEPGKYRCGICDKFFNSKSHLNRHNTQKHTGEDRRECGYCERIYGTLRQLRIHLSREHSKLETGETIVEKKHSCETCGMKCGIEDELKQHLEYCARREKRKSKLKSTERVVVVEESPVGSSGVTTPSVKKTRQKLDKSCILCGLECASMQSLKRHVLRKHQEKFAEATEIAKTYKPPEDGSSLPYQCLDCGRRLSNPSALSLHRRRVHELSMPHVCEVCGKAYPIASELRKHFKRVHMKNSVLEVDPSQCAAIARLVKSDSTIPTPVVLSSPFVSAEPVPSPSPPPSTPPPLPIDEGHSLLFCKIEDEQ